MKPKISKITLSVALAIIISACFMRQLLNFVLVYSSRGGVSLLIWGAFVVATFYLVTTVLRQASFTRCFGALGVAGVAILIAALMPAPEERVHILKYGFLGALFFRDNEERLPLHYLLLIAPLFTSAVSGIDEIFQYFLPYRVGDLRDVGFGALGGVVGALCRIMLLPERQRSLPGLLPH